RRSVWRDKAKAKIRIRIRIETRIEIRIVIIKNEEAKGIKIEVPKTEIIKIEVLVHKVLRTLQVLRGEEHKVKMRDRTKVTAIIVRIETGAIREIHTTRISQHMLLIVRINQIRINRTQRIHVLKVRLRNLPQVKVNRAISPNKTRY